MCVLPVGSCRLGELSLGPYTETWVKGATGNLAKSRVDEVPVYDRGSMLLHLIRAIQDITKELSI